MNFLGHLSNKSQNYDHPKNNVTFTAFLFVSRFSWQMWQGQFHVTQNVNRLPADFYAFAINTLFKLKRWWTIILARNFAFQFLTTRTQWHWVSPKTVWMRFSDSPGTNLGNNLFRIRIENDIDIHQNRVVHHGWFRDS